MKAPLMRLLFTQRQWLWAHADAYVDLAAAQGALALLAWRRHAILVLLAIAGLALALGLAGVAAMLWAVSPAGTAAQAWVLVCTPLLPLAGAAACTFAARRCLRERPLDEIGRQWRLDRELLRAADAP